MKRATRPTGRRGWGGRIAGLVVVVLLWEGLAGCELFSPRTPEPPVGEGGSFLQPDTPEQVIDNVRAAIAELNTPNYRRSLEAEIAYTPSASAEARDPALWAGWGLAEEERYFSTLVAAASFATGHELTLNDRVVSVVGDTRYVLDASYVLTVNHNRPDAPTSVQGRLVWTIVQGEDGLWGLQEWTDRAFEQSPSWSDLKAEFAK